MGSSSTVEAATAMDLASAEGLSATESAVSMDVSVCVASVVTAVEAFVSIRISAMVAPTPAPIPPIASAVPATIPEPGWMSPVIPRARSDENTAYEILRSVVAIRSAGIRIVIVVSIRTNWRSGDIRRSHSDSNSYSNLRLRIRKRHH